MRILPSERVIFENNPLAEVVCQVRIEPLPAYKESVTVFNKKLESIGYPVTHCEEVNTLLVQVDPDNMQGRAPQQEVEPIRVYHATTADGVWRISHSIDFIAVTCMKYIEWEFFNARLVEAVDLFNREFGSGDVARIGLRYRDIIDREKLGLDDCEWKDLLHPFVLGPFAAQNLCSDGVPEKDVASFFFQSNLLLDDCSLLFQGGLARPIDSQKTVFVIDADFYLESEDISDCMTDVHRLNEALNRLHSSAGNLFLKTIKEKLYHALSPRG